MDLIYGLLPKFSTHVDFVGQGVAERIFQVTLVITAAVGFIIGYALQRFSVAVLSTLGGFVLSCLLVLPPWPYLRRHPIKWLRPTTQGGQSKR